jgi:hypothetical protein
MSTTRIAGSLAARSSAAASSAYIPTVSAFFLSGRLIWMRMMPSATSVRMRLLMTPPGFDQRRASDAACAHGAERSSWSTPWRDVAALRLRDLREDFELAGLEPLRNTRDDEFSPPSRI